MVEVDVELTREFNTYVTSILDDIFQRDANMLSISIESSLINMIDNTMLNSILNNSFDNDEKSLVRDENVKLNRCEVYDGGDKVECCICQDDENMIVKGCKVYKCKECKNCFHKDCMDNWIKMKAECPMCRCDVSKDVIHVNAFEEWLSKNIDI